jgi:hypothetical protein
MNKAFCVSLRKNVYLHNAEHLQFRNIASQHNTAAMPILLQAETKTEAIPETAPYIVPDVDANTKADADNHAAKARQARKIARPTKNKVGYRKK